MDLHSSAVRWFSSWGAKIKTMGAKRTWKAQGHQPQETHPGVLAESQPLSVSVLLWCLQVTKSLLLSEMMDLSLCLLMNPGGWLLNEDVHGSGLSFLSPPLTCLFNFIIIIF